MKLLSHCITIVLLACAATAQAQTVYRCGNSYSQIPCPGGKTVDANDSRTPEQRKAHEASVRQEKRSGNSLERTRHNEESTAVRAAVQADQAERAREREAQRAAEKKAAASKNKLPAYRAP